MKAEYGRKLPLKNVDATPALEAIRTNFPQAMIDLVMLVRTEVLKTKTHRRIGRYLEEFTDWSVASLDNIVLMRAQLP